MFPRHQRIWALVPTLPRSDFGRSTRRAVAPIVVVGLILPILIQRSLAQAPIGDRTSCTAVGRDTAELGRQRFQEIDSYVARILDEVDAASGQRILSKLSVDGRENLHALIFVECRSNPRSTIREQAQKVYKGMRAAQRDLN